MTVPDGSDPLNGEFELQVPEWHLLPAMHGPVLRHGARDGPFKFVSPKQLGHGLLTSGFKQMCIHEAKLGTKTMAPRMGAIKYYTEQFSGRLLMLIQGLGVLLVHPVITYPDDV